MSLLYRHKQLDVWSQTALFTWEGKQVCVYNPGYCISTRHIDCCTSQINHQQEILLRSYACPVSPYIFCSSCCQVACQLSAGMLLTSDPCVLVLRTTPPHMLFSVLCSPSLLLFRQVTQPAIDWLLQQYATPIYGAVTVSAWQKLLFAAFQVLWLLPVYLVSLFVSCIW